MKNMLSNICVLLLTAVLLASLPTSILAKADTDTIFNPGKMAEGAPTELQHWGKMVGRWSTSEEGLKPDGSGWQASTGADWDFFWAFDGWGIQDNYTSPPMSEPLEDESGRQRGINLRIYNPQEKKWILTWLTTASKKPMNLTAVSNDTDIVMLRDDKDSNGNYSRITFFDITDNTFEWKLEWSADEESWREVYRIHGERKQ